MMANYLDKVNLPIAVQDHTKLDLGHQHITTTDFMELGVDYIREMVPGERTSIKMETYAKLNAMPVPTFSRSNLKHHAFFVPMRTIYRPFNDMIVNTVHVGSDGSFESTGLVTGVPTITNKVLMEIFYGSVGNDSASTTTMLYTPELNPGVTTFPAYDVLVVTGYTGSTAQTVGYNFTGIGRQVYKTLCALGYQICFDADYVDTFSALPLLAYLKVYADYFFPNQYENLSFYKQILTWCNFDSTGSYPDFDPSILRSLLSVCSYVQFDSDYFTSAWDNPVSPSDGNFSTEISFPDITVRRFLGTPGLNANSYVTNERGLGGGYNEYSTPVLRGRDAGGNSVASPNNLSDYALKSLKSLTRFLKRHQLVGGKTYERLLSRYGVSTPSEKLNRSVYLGTEIQPIQIGDIYSSSDTSVANSTDTSGAKLGDFAGKGQSYGSASWDYSTDEFGYIIVLTSVVPNTGYFQGVHKQNYRTTMTDFYIPEFDQLGVEPIRATELYVPSFAYSGMTSGSAITSQVFGFAPRYAAYKTSFDTLSGNFRCPSLNGSSALFPETINGANSWHTMRVFDGAFTFSGSSANIVHSPDFMMGYKNAGQFKRLFYDIDPVSPDNMTLIHNFEIASWFPGKPLYDTFDFEEEEDNPKRMTTQANGVKVN